MKILIFSAHPDDSDFACSGTTAKKSTDNEIHYVIATDGRKGRHLDISTDEFIKMREEEQRNAANVLGVKSVTFLHFEDGELENNNELREKLVKEIRDKKPDIIISMDPAAQKFDSVYRYHKDHRTIGISVFDASYPASGNKNFFPSAGEPWEAKELWFFGGTPNHYEDITDFIDKKLEALKQHKSQIKIEEVEKFVKKWSEEMGKKAGFKHAEGFRIVKFEH